MFSSRTTTENDIMKTEDCSLDDSHQPTTKINEKNMSSNHQEKAGGGLRKANNHDVTQTICLFRKYLLAKNQHNKRHISSSTPLIPPKFAYNNLSRPPTLLERQLFPEMRDNGAKSKSTNCAKSSKEQLTIFYAGTINVYDNVPFDKAQAIMFLAGESTLSKPSVDMTKSEVTKTPFHRPNLKPFFNLQSDLPIARKRSLQHFIEKRRQRLVDKSPYFHLNTKNEKNEATSNNENQTLSLSPFPSRLGFFSPLSTNKVVN